ILVRLEVSNEGTRLLALTGLKRMSDMTELLLQDCQLERLPSALVALANLRSLDLQHNNLRTLEELLTLSHLRRLSTFRLAYNRILSLPASVGMLRGLELLDLSNNQLRSLPPALFTLRCLRKLLLSGNLLESLPPELFNGCLELRILNVAHNSLCSLPRGISGLSQLCRLDLRSNCLEELPAELGCCPGLHAGGLLVEDWLFHSLPLNTRDVLSHPHSTCGAYSEERSRPESDSFPYFSPTLWSFSSALESQI
uniref:Uncharacterized protein n=1 Tax=Sphaeramia orbicularis TaxID=375764 RepID=A0A673CI47_9TELE